jgi:hypothetical protein
MVWHWGSSHPIWRRPFHAGRARFGMQVFVCVYLLLFSTLASVMTGYRAELSAFFGHDSDETGLLFPINQLVLPRMAMYDGDRVGLSKELFAHDIIVYPEGAHEPDSNGIIEHNASYHIDALLANSRDFVEPYGVLVDSR